MQENREIQYKAKSYLWLKILIPVVILLVIAGLIVKTFVLPDYFCKKEYESLATKVTTSNKVDKDGKLKKFNKIYEINSDFAGFIYLPKSEKGFPFVKPEANDEDFYKNHTFSGKSNKYGTPFTNADLDKNGDNSLIVIKGNYFSDDLLLGEISRYTNQKYADKNRIIKMETLYGSGVYTVFSAFSYKGEEPFLVDRQNFLSDKLFYDYCENLYENSEIDMTTAVDSSDRLIVFMAEGEKETFVLAARLLRVEETAEYITERTDEASTDTSSSTSSKNEEKDNDSSQFISSFQNTSSTTSSKKPASQNLSGRIEQTGLTDNIDKTQQIQMDNIVTMVNVVGSHKDTAKNIVENTLGLNVTFKKVESDKKKNIVVEQSVASGAEVSADVTVVLSISKGVGEGKTLVPELIGTHKDTAEMVLENSNLELGKKTSTKSSLEYGTIITQSIDPKTQVNVNTKINITYSDGSLDFKSVKMPNIVGKSQSKAKTLVKEAGLRVGTVKTVKSSKTAGTVVSQGVPAGEKVQEGSVIDFSISNGSKVNNLTVTNMSGWSVTINGKSYASGAKIKGDYMDIIPCIIEAEMGSGYELEALKAQSVAAYCWLINAGSTSGSAPAVPMKTPGSRAIKAAEAVNGEKLKSGSETAQTYYFAISAGYTANCKDVWWADISYLRAVESPGCKSASGFKTTVSYSASKMKSMIESKYNISLSGVSKSNWIKVKYDENGAYARKVTLGGKKDVTGSSIRETLCSYSLRSTAYKVKYDSSSDKFTFTVRGYGHGIGMSQVGANYYAKQGWTYKEILLHYYKGTKLS